MNKNNKYIKEPPYVIMSDIPSVTIEGVTQQFMVNKKKAPDNWWTFNQPEKVFKIYALPLALEHVSRLKNNNPQVVSWRIALKILENQAKLTY